MDTVFYNPEVWNNAPEWADYRTIDSDGTVQYHEDPPTMFTPNGTWMSHGRKVAFCKLPTSPAKNGLRWELCTWMRPGKVLVQDEKPLTVTLTALDILASAPRHISDRASTYDQPQGERSMGKAVGMFNACHGTALTEAQGWHLMELVKHVRFFTAGGYHADSMEDGINYAALRGEAKANGRG